MEYNEEIQSLLISYMLADADSYTACQNIVNPDYFDDRLRSSVRFIKDYADKFKTLPQLIQIKAATGHVFDPIETTRQHSEWFLETIETFARTKALEHAVLDGVDLVANGRGGELEKRIKDAMSISLVKDLGTDYFADPVTRIQRMRDNSNFFSTGWKGLDAKLYGGFTKGGLNIFAAGSGVGKSLWLQNIALNWAKLGHHVIYISLELSEDLVANRIDAMLSGYATKNIFGNIKDVALKVRMAGMNTKGSLTIKRLPESTTTANDLRAFLKEYEIKTGKQPDCLVVDYLDLMAPNGGKIDKSDLFVKDKYVSEELRALLSEWDILGATASQLNRQSVEATEFDHSHISGGISKIQTADLAFGIYATPSMKERGEMQIQFLKTRSSSAVGSRLTFKYDPITMLISDGEDVDSAQETMSTEDLRKELSSKAGIRHQIAAVVEQPSVVPAQVKTGLDVLGLIRRTQGRSEL